MNFIFDCFKEINHLLRSHSNEYLNGSITTNASGDSVKYIDQRAHEIFLSKSKQNPYIVGFISEEHPSIVFFNKKKSGLVLAVDPIDGSKGIQSNITVGTIYTVMEYDAVKDKIVKIIEAGYCLYSFSTIAVRANNNGVKLYALDKNNEFIFNQTTRVLGNDTIYATNEAYSESIDSEFRQLLSYLKNKGYYQRWIGCMAADCHQIIMRGGIFMYPCNTDKPQGKLRFLYEAVPFSYIFDKLGGVGFNENGDNIINTLYGFVLKNINPHLTTSLFLCKKELKDEINVFIESVKNA